jgi:hypothetical protein
VGQGESQERDGGSDLPMYDISLFGIITVNHPVQQIYPNKNEKNSNSSYTVYPRQLIILLTLNENVAFLSLTFVSII